MKRVLPLKIMKFAVVMFGCWPKNASCTRVCEPTKTRVLSGSEIAASDLSPVIAKSLLASKIVALGASGFDAPEDCWYVTSPLTLARTLSPAASAATTIETQTAMTSTIEERLFMMSSAAP